jgi:HAMP domain-containing protein
MSYNIDQGHPLYTLLQPVLEDLQRREELTAALDKRASEGELQIQKMHTELGELKIQIGELTQQVQGLTVELQKERNLPRAPEPWEVIADKIISAGLALQKFGVPYAFGGDSFQEGGLDCSGFTKMLYDLFAGTKMRRVSGDQASQGTAVEPTLERLRKGDLVFFTYSQRNDGKPTHLGIYLGEGKMLHTANDTDRINVATVNLSTVTAARRMF